MKQKVINKDLLIRYLDSLALRNVLESVFLKKNINALSLGRNHGRRKEEK